MPSSGDALLISMDLILPSLNLCFSRDIDSPMAGLECISSVGALRACDGEGCEEEQLKWC